MQPRSTSSTAAQQLDAIPTTQARAIGRNLDTFFANRRAIANSMSASQRRAMFARLRGGSGPSGSASGASSASDRQEGHTLQPTRQPQPTRPPRHHVMSQPPNASNTRLAGVSTSGGDVSAAVVSAAGQESRLRVGDTYGDKIVAAISQDAGTMTLEDAGRNQETFTLAGDGSATMQPPDDAEPTKPAPQPRQNRVWPMPDGSELTIAPEVTDLMMSISETLQEDAKYAGQIAALNDDQLRGYVDDLLQQVEVDGTYAVYLAENDDARWNSLVDEIADRLRRASNASAQR